MISDKLKGQSVNTSKQKPETTRRRLERLAKSMRANLLRRKLAAASYIERSKL